jgi:glycosyltransferase involved in cell wall biosynthesis
LKISAVITCYESKKTIGLTLTSLYGQTRQPDEIIVTDDGSTPETCDFVRDLLATIGRHSSIETVFVTHERSSPYRLNTIRNSGIQKAGGDLILLLDGDILLPREFLSGHEQVHQSILKMGTRALVSCVRKNISKSGIIEEGRKSEWGQELDRELSSSPWTELELEPEQTLSQCSFFKDDWERVGQFDTDFDGHWGFDEIEFAYRMKNAGVRLTCHGLVYHIDEGPGAGSRDHSHNNKLYLRKISVG